MSVHPPLLSAASRSAALRAPRREPIVLRHTPTGLTAPALGEVLPHTAVYAAVPAADSAFAVAQRVLSDGD
jgi:alkylhydroperoxidase/carboxymuconolactone decarboxylase family protein YurZ